MKIGNKVKGNISDKMFGLFFEDINYAADGGLYAEMIENRSFESKEAFGTPGNMYTVDDYGYGWSPVYTAGDKVPRMQYVSGRPLSAVNPHYLRFTANKAMQGFKNQAYDGIVLKKDMSYRVSFYARCVRYEGEGIRVCVSKDGKVYGECDFTMKKPARYAAFCDVEPPFKTGWESTDAIGDHRRTLNLAEYAKEADWVKYEGTLCATDDVRNADFIIYLMTEGIIEFDLISMIPEDAVEGIFRKDLFDALNSIQPGFIRFPGGCIVEGISLDNRYNWKETVGELKDRRYKPNLWAFIDNRDIPEIDAQRGDPHYGQSFGIGFYEYFLLCELLKADAVPVIGIGVACQFRTDEIVDINDPELESYIQDALDLIEFANGPVDTKWGGLRARMGHPDSFNLTMLAVGNEQWDTTSIHMFERIDRFEKAIHAVYPDMKLLGTAGPFIDFPISDRAWQTYRDKQKLNSSYCEAVDEHYYVSPQWLYDKLDLYDEYPREIGVFAGEYAAHTENKGNNMEGALAEAAFMTGIEKNADVVRLASYAPLFNRVGHSQWKPDMIWFDDKDVFLSPNYYVQKMYANNVGDYIVDLEGQEKSLRADKIYVSVTKKEEGTVIVKAANCSDKEYELKLTDEAGAAFNKKAVLQTLSSAGDEPLDGVQPSLYTVKEEMLADSVVLKANTFTVIRL